MRSLTLYSACSIDGFIARSTGGVDWLEDPALLTEGEDYGYRAFYDSIDTTLMGYETYRKILDFDVPFPYPDKTNYVFSRSPRPETEYVRMVKEEAISFVEELKRQAGSGIWLVGGANFSAQLLQAGLIDRMILSIAPLVLGTGISLFSGLATTRYFSLLEARTFPKGWIQLVYEKNLRPE